jgi:hypothetical protein
MGSGGVDKDIWNLKKEKNLALKKRLKPKSNIS